MKEKDWRIPPKEFGVFVRSDSDFGNGGDIGIVDETWQGGWVWCWTKGESLSKARSPLKVERRGPTKTSGVEKI